MTPVVPSPGAMVARSRSADGVSSGRTAVSAAVAENGRLPGRSRELSHYCHQVLARVPVRALPWYKVRVPPLVRPIEFHRSTARRTG